MWPTSEICATGIDVKSGRVTKDMSVKHAADIDRGCLMKLRERMS